MAEIAHKAFAKINLHLDVTGIREDGFHSVSTVMQSVSLYDEVYVSLSDTEGFTLSCDVSGVPLDEKNLAARAFIAYKAATGMPRGAHISIKKRIPMAAGLAGGSADAAATLLALNDLCGKALSISELCEIGARLGSDVPFCIVGGTAFADGKGEVLHPFPSMPECTIVIACGGEGVSTPWAYRTLDEIYNGFSSTEDHAPVDTTDLRRAAENKDIAALARNLYNIFEEPILSTRPVAAKLKSVMLECGALGAMMSGSGPSVFGIFTDESAVKLACEKINQLGITPHICKPKN